MSPTRGAAMDRGAPLVATGKSGRSPHKKLQRVTIALNLVAPSLVIRSQPMGSSLVPSCRCASTPLSARAGVPSTGTSGCPTARTGSPNNGCGQLSVNVHCLCDCLSAPSSTLVSLALLPSAVSSLRYRRKVSQRGGSHSRSSFLPSRPVVASVALEIGGHVRG